MFDDLARVDATESRRLGLVSDSHGPVDGRILDALQACDFIIHAGDVGGSAALDSLACLAALAAVRGNNDTPDRWQSLELGRLKQLSEVVRVDLSDGHLIIAHGHQIPQAKQRHRRLREAFPDALAVVYGHSHRLQIDTDYDPWVLNPGACGRARTFGGPSGLILERKSRRWVISTLRFAPATATRKRRR